MPQCIKKVRTPDGDLPIDFNSLANLPNITPSQWEELSAFVASGRLQRVIEFIDSIELVDEHP